MCMHISVCTSLYVHAHQCVVCVHVNVNVHAHQCVCMCVPVNVYVQDATVYMWACARILRHWNDTQALSCDPTV